MFSRTQKLSAQAHLGRLETEKMSKKGHSHGVATTGGAGRRRLRSNHVSGGRGITRVYPGGCQES